METAAGDNLSSLAQKELWQANGCQTNPIIMEKALADSLMWAEHRKCSV